MRKILALINQKGGVGKTTTAFNLASCVSLVLNKKVLLVDLDPQGNSSTALGISHEQINEHNLYNMFIGKKDMKDCIVQTSIKNLKMAPSNNNLAGAEVELIHEFSRESKLKNALDQVSEEFDYIILDCPPSLNLLTINGLTAANTCVVPIQPEFFSLGGVAQLMESMELVKNHLNPELSISGVLITMYDGRNTLHKSMKNALEEHFGGHIFHSIIPRNVKLSESPNYSLPIIEYDIKSSGAKAYLQFTKELYGNEPFDQCLEKYLQERKIKNYKIEDEPEVENEQK